MSRWAWWLTVGGLAIGLVTDVFAAFGPVLTVQGTVPSLLAIVALVYLFLPHVRRAFATHAVATVTPPPEPAH